MRFVAITREFNVTTSIDLVVRGLDLDHDETDELLSAQLSEFGWSSRDGITLATVYVTVGCDAVATVCDAANRIEHVTGAKVVAVYEDLVGVSDVAARSGLHRETVRLLTLGKRGPGRFPAHRGTVGAGANSARIWRWSDVVPWLQEHYELCADESTLTDEQTAQVNAFLAKVTHDFDKAAWRRAAVKTQSVSAEVSVGVMIEPRIIQFVAADVPASRYTGLLAPAERMAADVGFVLVASA